MNARTELVHRVVYGGLARAANIHRFHGLRFLAHGNNYYEDSCSPDITTGSPSLSGGGR